MASVKRQIIVPADLAGARLDKVAAVLIDDFSRAELTKWIKEGSLTLDGHAVVPKTKVHGGEEIVLQAQRSQREA